MTTITTEPGWCPLCGAGTPHETVANGIDFEYHTVPDEFAVEGCSSCGTRFLDPRPSDEVIPLLYPDHYEPYRFTSIPAPIRIARDVVQGRKVSLIKAMVGEQATIVDVGCGVGSLLRLLRRKGRPSWRLLGWDFPGAHLDRLAADGFEIMSAPIDMEHCPDGTADLVVLNQVIEHFARPDDLLAVVARMLRPGGLVLIETPDIGGLDARWFRRRFWGGYHFPRHLVLFSSVTLRELVERSGFEVVTTGRLVSPAFWNQSIHHLLSERTGGARLAGFFTIRNPLTLGVATIVDLATRPFSPTSNQRLVARLPVLPAGSSAR